MKINRTGAIYLWYENKPRALQKFLLKVIELNLNISSHTLIMKLFSHNEIQLLDSTLG